MGARNDWNFCSSLFIVSVDSCHRPFGVRANGLDATLTVLSSSGNAIFHAAGTSTPLIGPSTAVNLAIRFAGDGRDFPAPIRNASVKPALMRGIVPPAASAEI